MNSRFVTADMTESFVAELASPPTVDGVALLEEARAVLEALLAEHSRPELHQQILKGFAEARELLAEIPGAEPMLAVLQRPIPGYEDVPDPGAPW